VSFERFDTSAFGWEGIPAKAHDDLPALDSEQFQHVYAALDAMECGPRPRSMSEEQWFVLLKDLRHVANKWMDIALGCGWGLMDLFGAPPGGLGRAGLMGVAVLLKGREIESIDQDRIIIGNRIGPPNAFYRHSPGASKPSDRAGSLLVWDAFAKEQEQ